jgi:monofunctional biosynthetic peptidoglycan transglycosylase
LLGASTITQQSARSLFLWQGRSWIRKGLEAYYTIWMELLLSKRRILELYVNVIEFGDGIYGIEAAAQHYYGKSARDLTREEAAMLAAILPAPRRWNPLAPNRIAKSRWEMILREMDSARLPWDSGLSVVQASASDHEPANAPTKSNPGRENEMATNSSPAATP